MTKIVFEQPNLDLLPPKGMFVDGKYIIDPSGSESGHIYPATGQVIAPVALAGAQGVEEVVRSARAALPAWRKDPALRRDVMLRFASLCRQNGERLSKVVTMENGLVKMMADGVGAFAANWFSHYAGYTDKMAGEVEEVIPGQALAYHVREPYGVVAILMPFNAPVMNLGLTAAAALATGNVVIVKPSYLIPFSTSVLAELFIEAGGPPGVFNVLPCKGAIGNLLCSHPGVDKIHLTGSMSAGIAVMQAAAKNITPVGLELGGKSPSVVFNDADLDVVCANTVGQLWRMAGQVCGKQARVLVQSGVYDKLLSMTTVAAEKIVIGDPAKAETMHGPVVSQDQCDEIMGFIERAKKSNTCRLVMGGERLGGDLAGGYYIAPTIYADVDPRDELFREEVFGPVVTFTKFETEEEAIHLANDTDLGLCANVFTQDIKRAHRVGLAMEAGNVVLNGGASKGAGAAIVTAARAFGGYKNSGFGRVGGVQGLKEFTHVKSMVTVMA